MMQNRLDLKSNSDKFHSLKNKIVLITGTSKGIGKEISLGFLKNGSRVIGLSSGKEKKTIIRHKKYNHFYCNLENKNEIKKFFNKLNKFKKIDILVNNAGVSIEEVENFDKNFENFNKVIQTNLVAAYILTKLLLNSNKKTKTIINISSIGGILGFPNNPSYQSSKAGLIGLTRSIARDYGKFGINCNVVLPGYFKTKMNKKSFNNKIKKKQRSDLTILGRWGELKELIGTIMFLSSDSSKYITGQCITVDGGISAKGL